MYAVVKAGGSQHKVGVGDTLTINRLNGQAGDTVTLPAVLLVDGDTVLAAGDDLAGAQVRARVVGQTKGPKITGFTYKNKTNNRRRWGHRQRYATIEITGITRG